MIAAAPLWAAAALAAGLAAEIAGQPEPALTLPAISRGSFTEVVYLPVTFDAAGAPVAGLSFSLEYDDTCLDPDLNNDSGLDYLIWSAPPGFTTTALFGQAGRVDLVIADLNPPIELLPSGVPVQVGFLVVCPPVPLTSSLPTSLAFSPSLPPTFSDPAGQDLPGAAGDAGLVRIWEAGIVFADGFEGGDTAAWALATP